MVALPFTTIGGNVHLGTATTEVVRLTTSAWRPSTLTSQRRAAHTAQSGSPPCPGSMTVRAVVGPQGPPPAK